MSQCSPQAIALAKRPHVIVGTPGRVVDHLSNTKGFSLKALKHLVLDEADKLLDMDFEQEIDQILKVGGGKILVWGCGGVGWAQAAPGVCVSVSLHVSACSYELIASSSWGGGLCSW
jgi:hypothetical protein